VTYFSQYTTASGYEADARETKQDTAFDGDGRAVMENKRERMCDLAESPEECEGTWVGHPVHYLVSSVTGQKINTMYDGENSEYYVYMGQTPIVRNVPDGETVHREFTVTDPVTGSTAPMAFDGTVSLHTRTELAALGTAIPLFEPPRSLPPPSNYENGHVSDSEYGCVDPDTNDPMPCSLLAFMANSDYFMLPRDKERFQPQLPNYFTGADNRPMGYGNFGDASGYGYSGLFDPSGPAEGGGSKWIVDPTSTTVTQTNSGEMIHCDPEVAKRLNELKKDYRNNRLTNNGVNTKEFGFAVSVDTDGKLTVGEIVTSNKSTEVDIPFPKNDTLLATFHTHSIRVGSDINPSGSVKDGDDPKKKTDVSGALRLKNVDYVFSDDGSHTRLRLFNGKVPRTDKGEERFVTAADCPQTKKK